MIDGFLNEQKVLATAALVKEQRLETKSRIDDGSKFSLAVVSEKKMFGIKNIRKKVISDCELKKHAKGYLSQICEINLDRESGKDLFHAGKSNITKLTCKDRAAENVFCELSVTGSPKNQLGRSARHLAVSGTAVALENFFRMAFYLDSELSGSPDERLRRSSVYISGLNMYYDNGLELIEKGGSVELWVGQCKTSP